MIITKNDIRKLRQAMNLSQFLFGRLLGVSEQTVGSWESDHYSPGKVFQRLVIAVSKEDVPDKEIVELGQTWLDEGLSLFENNVERVHDLIVGKVKPQKCGRCDYCRSLKKLDRIVNLDDLIAGIF